MPQLNVWVSRHPEQDDAACNVHIERTDGSPLLTHRIGSDQRPFIHPIMAPGGTGLLTEDAPDHHPWQHGLYTGFNLVNDTNFWKDQAGEGTFASSLSDPPTTNDQSARWGIAADWLDRDGSKLIAERQHWTLVDRGNGFEIDLVWELHANRDVEIGQYMAGGLFLRMPYAPERGAVAINSEGQRNGDAEKQKARWAAVTMPIVGRADWAGMAIMDHPSNPAHPVTWRIDTEYGVSPSRCIAHSWTIPRGATDRYHFKLYVFDGQINVDAIEARWRAFADQ